MTARKKVLFACLVVGCFFVVLELSLAAIGVKPKLGQKDPFVGFAPDIPLFVSQPLQHGQMALVTALNKLTLFNQQAFPREKPVNTKRVFCVGGSTTRGFPFDDSTSFCGWLRELLPIVAPSHDWEVINAGASSYASYRVVRVMEELCQYAPDLFVVYSGHNEFMERRTYGGLIDAPDFVLAAEAMVMRTRVYAAMEKVVSNLRRKKRRQHSDDTVFGSDVHSLSNMEQVISWEDYTRNEKLSRQILRHFRFNLERMIEIANRVSAKIVLVVPACNLLHWSPYKSEHRAGLSKTLVTRCQDLLDQIEQAQASDDLQTALKACNAFLEIDDRFALAHYRRGQVLYALGRYEDAKVALQRARNEDVCPLRVLSVMQRIVLDTAAKHSVPVLDFAQVLEEHSDHGITDEQQFFDDVHPNVTTHGLLAKELLVTLSETGHVPSSQNWDRPSMQRVAKAIQGSINQDKRALALVEVSRTHAWAGQLDKSIRVARLAFAESPEFQEATINLADKLWRYGLRLLERDQSAAAAEQFREVVRLLPNNSAAKQQLRIAEQRSEGS